MKRREKNEIDRNLKKKKKEQQEKMEILLCGWDSYFQLMPEVIHQDQVKCSKFEC